MSLKHNLLKEQEETQKPLNAKAKVTNSVLLAIELKSYIRLITTLYLASWACICQIKVWMFTVKYATRSDRVETSWTELEIENEG